MSDIDLVCSLAGCSKKFRARGYCGKHYMIWRREQIDFVPIKGRGNTKHGRCSTVEWRAWHNMKQRCYNPNHRKYKDYGGRGIKLCAEWLGSFESFYSYVGNRPSLKHSIDRINNEGNYEPGNVRWATASQQMSNQRRQYNLT